MMIIQADHYNDRNRHGRRHDHRHSFIVVGLTLTTVIWGASNFILMQYDDGFDGSSSSLSLTLLSSIKSLETASYHNNTRRSSSSSRTIRLVHVLSPFVETSAETAADEKDDVNRDAYTYPLGLNQWATMQSINRALENVNDNHKDAAAIDVTVLCTVFQSDLYILSSPEANLPCHKFVVLQRSTRTHYPHIQPNHDLPFIADMIDAAMSYMSENNDDDGGEAEKKEESDGKDDSNRRDTDAEDLSSQPPSYHVMLTNSDIGLTPSFYLRVHEILQSVDSFSMNRMTVPLDGWKPNFTTSMSTTVSQSGATATPTVYDYAELSKFVDWSMKTTGIKHPGYDLFCMSSTVLNRITFGDMFLGRSPWGMNLNLLLQIMADSYINIESNPNGTFHLGDEKRWMKPDDTGGSSDRDGGSSIANVISVIRDALPLIGFCPCNDAATTMKNVLAVQNNINCAQWYLGSASEAEDDEEAVTSPTFIPGFVRHGWEEWYLSRVNATSSSSSTSSNSKYHEQQQEQTRGRRRRLIRDVIGRPVCRIQEQ